MKLRKKIKKVILSLIIAILSLSLVSPGKNANATQITTLLSMAFSFLGVPYEWGGNGPGTFDCSGFTSYIYKNSLGINIGRTTYDQIYSGSDVTNSDLQPGDLILPHAGHVMLYIGNNTVIHAPKTGDVVKVDNLYNIYSARRIVGTSPMESIIFDYKYYADTYPDLKAAYGYNYGGLLGHYIGCGIKEGRKPSQIFDPKYYLDTNADLKAAFGNNYEAAYDHFVTCGYNENRNSSQEFNISEYKMKHTEVSSMSNVNIYSMIIQSSKIEGIIFDYEYYADTYSDLKDIFGYDYEKLYNHYITCGIKEGRSPSQIFDPKYYLNANADLKAVYGENYEAAYKHFISNGYNEDRPSSEKCNIKAFKELNIDKLNGQSNLEAYKMYKENCKVKKYVVRFYDLFGKEISEAQNIISGDSAIAPDVPEIEGYDFVKWDMEFSNVTSDLYVYAEYTKKPDKIATITPSTVSPATETPSTSTPENKEPVLVKYQGDKPVSNVNGNNNGDKNNSSIGDISQGNTSPEGGLNNSQQGNNEKPSNGNQSNSDTYDYRSSMVVILLMFISSATLVFSKIKRS